MQSQIKLREKQNQTKNNFPTFLRSVFRTVSPGAEYHHNWHIDAISEHLMAAQRGEIRRLLINMPPRSLKSISVAVAWPAWLLGQDPSVQIMCGAYSQGLSYKHSVDTRNVIQSEWYRKVFPETILSHDQNEKGKFTTTKRGQRMAVSVGSTATGEGGDFLILDDPTNPEQAVSDAERETANRWFKNTFTSRLNDKSTGVIVVVMQRLHEEDVSGMLLAKGGWTHLNLEAQATEDKTISIGKFKREIKKGDLLDSVRLSKDVLEEVKRDMTAIGYAGQYQQNPTPDDGGILKKKHWRKWPSEEPPVCVSIIQCYDTAFGQKETNDFSARTTWGVFMAKGRDADDKLRPSVILLDSMEKRLDYPELKTEVIESARIYEPDVILIEDKASGQSLIQDLNKVGDLTIRAIKVDGTDKVMRANIAAIVLERGAVWYMERDWAKNVINQCAKFPNAKHDDIVDTCSMAWLYLRKRWWINVPDDDTGQNNLVAENRPQKSFYGHRPSD